MDDRNSRLAIGREGGFRRRRSRSVASSLLLRACLSLVALPLLVPGIQSCTATRNSDGSWNFTFAPDMVITAAGLEEALAKLLDLKKDCLNGTFGRPCTFAELTDITAGIDKVLDTKRPMSGGGGSTNPEPQEG